MKQILAFTPTQLIDRFVVKPSQPSTQPSTNHDIALVSKNRAGFVSLLLIFVLVLTALPVQAQNLPQQTDPQVHTESQDQHASQHHAAQVQTDSKRHESQDQRAPQQTDPQVRDVQTDHNVANTTHQLHPSREESQLSPEQLWQQREQENNQLAALGVQAAPEQHKHLQHQVSAHQHATFSSAKPNQPGPCNPSMVQSSKPSAALAYGLLDYTTMAQQLCLLQQNDRVTVTTIGQTSQGRDISMVEVTAPMTAGERRIQQGMAQEIVANPHRAQQKIAKGEYQAYRPVLVMSANIHGNEFEGTDAIIDYITYLANAQVNDKIIQETQGLTPAQIAALPTVEELLTKYRLVFIPSVNVDGRHAGVRTNALGVDLNRDHLVHDEQEVRVFQQALYAVQPVAVLDFHGYFSPDSTKLGLLEPSTPIHTLTMEHSAFMAAINPIVDQANSQVMRRTDITSQRPDATGIGVANRHMKPGEWDDWLPAYTSVWANHIGAVAITVEAPFGQSNPDHPSTAQSAKGNTQYFRAVMDALALQAMTTQQTGPTSLLATQVAAFANGVANSQPTAPPSGNTGPAMRYPAAWVIKQNQANPGGVYDVVSLLRSHNIRVFAATTTHNATVEGGQVFQIQPGDMVVPAHQARRNLAATILDVGADLTKQGGKKTTDIAAWSPAALWDTTVVRITEQLLPAEAIAASYQTENSLFAASLPVNTNASGNSDAASLPATSNAATSPETSGLPVNTNVAQTPGFVFVAHPNQFFGSQTVSPQSAYSLIPQTFADITFINHLIANHVTLYRQADGKVFIPPTPNLAALLAPYVVTLQPEPFIPANLPTVAQPNIGIVGAYSQLTWLQQLGFKASLVNAQKLISSEGKAYLNQFNLLIVTRGIWGANEQAGKVITPWVNQGNGLIIAGTTGMLDYFGLTTGLTTVGGTGIINTTISPTQQIIPTPPTPLSSANQSSTNQSSTAQTSSTTAPVTQSSTAQTSSTTPPTSQIATTQPSNQSRATAHYVHTLRGWETIPPSFSPVEYLALSQQSNHPAHQAAPNALIRAGLQPAKTLAQPTKLAVTIGGHVTSSLGKETGKLVATQAQWFLRHQLRGQADELFNAIQYVAPASTRPAPHVSPQPNGLPSYTCNGAKPIATSRVAGATRIQTALKLSATYTPQDTSTVVLAASHSWPDAIAAGPLASAHNAPLLLTPKDHVPAEVVAEIKRLAPSRVYVIGGRAAITNDAVNDLQNQLAASPNNDGEIGVAVERIAGLTRYDTAAAISALFKGNSTRVTITTGTTFADALSGAVYAGSRKGVLLLVPQDGEMPPSVANEIARHKDPTPTFIGGIKAVNPQWETVVANITKQSLQSGTDQVVPQRLAGATRYETAISVAQAMGITKPCVVTLVSGETFADALVASPTVVKENGVLLVTSTNTLLQPVSLYLNRLSPVHMRILGGTSVISTKVEQMVSLLD